MSHRHIFGAALGLGLLAAPLSAQAPTPAGDKQQICTRLENRTLPLGTWATYRWTGGQSDGSTLRLAIVGTEARGDTTFSWYEATIDDPQRPASRLIVQLLVQGAHLGGNIRSVVMKTGSQPAMRMPPDVARMMNTVPGTNLAGEIARECADMQVVGWEQLAGPQGAVRTLHLRHVQTGMDVWIEPDLSFGLVKAVMRDGTTLLLTGQGSGAKSSIAETPRDMPGFPAPPPPR
jgi:hypothetical protein